MPQTTTDPKPSTIPSSTASGNRLVSVDAFRGATMALMVIVNNAGGPSYKQLQHSEWNGWTITDTVFPTFLWIVGVAITLSLGKRLANGVPRSQLLGPIFRRALILYVLGLLVYVYPAFSLSTQRWMGVLQRIAICYLIASVIYLYTSIRGQIAWMLGLLAAYWLLMAFAPVPGYGSGRLDVAGNFAHYVDQIVLGRHNYAAHQNVGSGRHRQHLARNCYNAVRNHGGSHFAPQSNAQGPHPMALHCGKSADPGGSDLGYLAAHQ